MSGIQFLLTTHKERTDSTNKVRRKVTNNAVNVELKTFNKRSIWNMQAMAKVD
jgi:hypothetical protein